MARQSRPTFQKRLQEKARQEKRREKEQRRFEAKERKASVLPSIGGEDPDIAGMRPGPQAVPEEWAPFMPDEEEEKKKEEESAEAADQG